MKVRKAQVKVNYTHIIKIIIYIYTVYTIIALVFRLSNQFLKAPLDVTTYP